MLNLGRSHPVRVQETPLAESPTGTLPQVIPGQSESSPQAPQGQTQTESSRSRRSLPKTPSDSHQGSSNSPKEKEKRTSDVELAEDAFAYQSFNQDTGGRPQTRHSPSPVEGGAFVQEIQMEDLSRKKKRHGGRKFSDSRVANLSSSPSGHSRSHSHSPKRHDHSRSNRGRSTSLVIPNDQDKLDVGKHSKSKKHSPNRPHSKSSPPMPGTASSSKQRTVSSSSDEEEQRKDHRKKHVRDFLSQSPKTLRPADAPALSLLSQRVSDSCIGNVDTPKLMAPAEIDRIRSVSDASSLSSGSGSGSHIDVLTGVSSSKSLDSASAPHEDCRSKPKFTYSEPSLAEAEISKASVDSISVAKDEYSSDQLTKLAQIVQEHYHFQEDSNASESTSFQTENE